MQLSYMYMYVLQIQALGTTKFPETDCNFPLKEQSQAILFMVRNILLTVITSLFLIFVKKKALDSRLVLKLF